MKIPVSLIIRKKKLNVEHAKRKKWWAVGAKVNYTDSEREKKQWSFRKHQVCEKKISIKYISLFIVEKFKFLHFLEPSSSKPDSIHFQKKLYHSIPFTLTRIFYQEVISTSQFAAKKAVKWGTNTRNKLSGHHKPSFMRLNTLIYRTHHLIPFLGRAYFTISPNSHGISFSWFT